jgi:hypothetical protein
MGIKTVLAAAVALGMGAAQAAEPLQSRELLDGKVTMLVPAGLQPMSDAAKKERYPGRNAPAYVLTNADSSVNVAFDHKQMPIEPGRIGDLEAPIRQQMSSSRINSTGVRRINGADILVIDVDVDLPDGGKLHNLLTMTSYQGRLLAITYNCLLDHDPGCAALGPKMIESIRLRPVAAAK